MNRLLISCSEMYKIAPLLAFSWSSFISLAQKELTDPDRNYIIEQRIEMLADEAGESSVDYTMLFEELQYYYENPVNLNTASREQLEEFDLLSTFQINHLLSHIQKNGKLIAIYELQSIDGFSLAQINLILPFVKVTSDVDAPHISLKEVIKNGRNDLFIRWQRTLEQSEGYKPVPDSIHLTQNKKYLGSPDRLYTRYRFKYGNKISFGVTFDKDAGEVLFRQPKNLNNYNDSLQDSILNKYNLYRKGFDYYSAHFFLQDFGKLKRLAVGDYQVQLGQGLTFWSGLGFGKTSDVLSIKRNALVLRPYTSASENMFMRGAAATVELVKGLDLTAFVSRKKLDANFTAQLDSASGLEDFVISSFQTSGYHRLPSELNGKNSIQETIYGGNLNYKKTKGGIGFSVVKSQWGAEIRPKPTVYNQFDFYGNNNLNLGADYSYIFRNFNFFGEVSRSQNRGLAFVNGALIGLSPNLMMTVLYRDLGRDYQALYSRPVSENTQASNEKGLFLGLNAKITESITLSGYFDRFKFPWMKYGINSPSDGIDYLAQATYQPSKKITFYVRYKQERKLASISGIVSSTPYQEAVSFFNIPLTGDKGKENLRFNISCKISDALTIRSRVEFLRLEYNFLNRALYEYGYLVYQDIMYNPMKFPLSASVRFALFDTDSYNSRIYAYENDVLYAFSIPAYYYRGMRSNLTLQYNLNRHTDIWFRVAQYYYTNRNYVGSDLNRIDGNTNTDVKVQVRFKF